MTKQEVRLSIKSKMFAYVVGDTTIPLLDDEGYPVYKIAFRILEAQEIRRYFSERCSETKKIVPSCWSDDGVNHAADVVEYQAYSCGSCARAGNGCNKFLKVTACDQNGMQFVVNLSQSTIKQDSHKTGWVKFDDIESDIVAVSFDTTPYPKLVFKNL